MVESRPACESWGYTMEVPMLNSESPEFGLMVFGMGVATLYGLAFAAILGELLLRQLFDLSVLLRDAHLLVSGIL